MSFKCKKCLRVKPVKFFTITTTSEKVCDHCQALIDEQEVKRSEEMKRFINCENNDQILTGYAETKSARKTQRIRSRISDIAEDLRLKKELSEYE